MKKKMVVISSIVLVVALLTGAYFVVSKQSQKQEAVVQTSPTPTPFANLTTREDPAGFSFQYPSDIALNPHEEDKENYAHIELTHSAHAGSLIVWMKDTDAEDALSWVKSDQRYGNASSIDTTLGGNPAVKVSINEPVRKATVSVLDGLLVLIEVDPIDSEYWSAVNDSVVKSFKFTAEDLESVLPQDQGGEGGVEVVVDEEETIE